jgi:hypothetical protein
LAKALKSLTKHDEDIAPMPSIHLANVPDCIYSDTSLNTNDTFNIMLVLSASKKYNKLLTRLTVKRTFNNITKIEVDSSLSVNSLNQIFTFISNPSKGNEIWKITVYDEDGRSISKSFTINTSYPGPTIEFIYDYGFISSLNTYMPYGEIFKVGIDANIGELSYATLTNFKITKTLDNNTSTILDSTINTENFNFIGHYNSNDEETVEKWEFKITDSHGETASKTINIHTLTLTPMDNEYSGTIYNSLGDNPDAWDLILNNSLSYGSGDENIDIYNNTTSMYVAPYKFNNGWESLNGTLFLRINYYEYENCYLESAIDAFSGASLMQPSTFTYGVEAEDIFVARLRETDNYTIIKVINVDYTEDDNLDKIDFVYKKL